MIIIDADGLTHFVVGRELKRSEVFMRYLAAMQPVQTSDSEEATPADEEIQVGPGVFVRTVDLDGPDPFDHTPFGAPEAGIAGMQPPTKGND